MPITIVMAAGGTGGHIMPALAVANVIKEKEPEAKILFVGVGRPAEKEILGKTDYETYTVKGAGLKGKGILGKVKGAFKGVRGTYESIRLLKNIRPDVVFATGSYASGGVGVASSILRVPLIIHEQNRIPGLTNKILGKLADLIFLGDKGALEQFSSKKSMYTGNPVRREILTIKRGKKKVYDWEGHPFVILVMGGSQGADGVNSVMEVFVRHISELPYKVKIIHQTGEKSFEKFRDLYSKIEIEHIVKPFFQDVPELLKEADIFIGRSGALTLAELAASGLPSILIPYPHAANNHQWKNATTFEEAGAGILLAEEDQVLQYHMKESAKMRNVPYNDKRSWIFIVEQMVPGLVRDLMRNPPRLREMSKAARSLSPDWDAAELMADSILLIAREGKEGVKKIWKKIEAGEEPQGEELVIEEQEEKPEAKEEGKPEAEVKEEGKEEPTPEAKEEGTPEAEAKDEGKEIEERKETEEGKEAPEGKEEPTPEAKEEEESTPEGKETLEGKEEPTPEAKEEEEPK